MPPAGAGLERVTVNVPSVEGSAAFIPAATETVVATTPEGVTDSHVVPALNSSISAFGVAEEFLKAIDENVVGVVAVPDELETPPVGSLPPNEPGFTHNVEISLDAPLKSYLSLIHI